MKAACFAQLFIFSLLQLARSLAAVIVHLAGARRRRSSSLLMQNSLCIKWERYLTSVNMVPLKHADLPARFQRWTWSAGGNSGHSPGQHQYGCGWGQPRVSSYQPMLTNSPRAFSSKETTPQSMVTDRAPTCSHLAFCLKAQISGKVIKGLANSLQLSTRGDYAVVLRLHIQGRNL